MTFDLKHILNKHKASERSLRAHKNTDETKKGMANSKTIMSKKYVKTDTRYCQKCGKEVSVWFDFEDKVLGTLTVCIDCKAH